METAQASIKRGKENNEQTSKRANQERAFGQKVSVLSR
jgi:hypothetical protein